MLPRRPHAIQEFRILLLPPLREVTRAVKKRPDDYPVVVNAIQQSILVDKQLPDIRVADFRHYSATLRQR